MPLTFQLLFSGLIAVALAIVVVPLVWRAGDRASWPSAFVAAVAVILGSTLAYSSLSSWHWPEAGTGQTPPPMAQRVPASLDIPDLEARTRASPDDVQAWALLGVAYLRSERVDEAVDALDRAQALSAGTSADITLAFVDALVAQGDANRPRVNTLVEDLLFYAPDNPRALLYGAELAFSRQEYGTARERWQVLLDKSLAESSEQSLQVAEVLRGRIALADQHMGVTPPADSRPSDTSPAPAAPAEIPAPAAPSVTVEVDIDPVLRDRVAAGAPLFVLARTPGEAGPPIAVVRRSITDVPFEVVLSDRDAMMPSRVLSGFDTVEIVARIASGGTPVAQSGDLYGAVTLQRSGTDRVRVVISQVYP